MNSQTLSSLNSRAGWGQFHPAGEVHSVTELKPGDLVLQRARKPGFTKPCLHVLEVMGGDPSGANRPFVRVRLVDPGNPDRANDARPAWVVLWEFCLTEGRTELFRAAIAD